MMSQSPAVSVLLIDGENVPAHYAGEIIAKIGAGAPAEARVYGDFSTPALQRWRDCAPKYGLRLYQTAGKAGGKNSADMLLTVDAMDLLRVSEYLGFCIVSGDHDFVPLVMRLRRAGKIVTGIGMANAASGFRAACNAFHVLKEPVAAAPKPVAKKKDVAVLFDAVKNKITGGHEGWIEGAALVLAIRQAFPDVEWSDYGPSSPKTPKKVFKAHPDFDVDPDAPFRVRRKPVPGVVPFRKPTG